MPSKQHTQARESQGIDTAIIDKKEPDIITGIYRTELSMILDCNPLKIEDVIGLERHSNISKEDTEIKKEVYN
jgi:hypothetical protein